ncbi:protein of unknown function [Nitrospina watsonii]|uniref:Uncharacterized protein n=1 Tax=Nitrospina watsonii TaxID=1323948 RepID=A0ABN8VUH3_9BACT|nr:protein of unknown function [Nitrospina watsonii]
MEWTPDREMLKRFPFGQHLKFQRVETPFRMEMPGSNPEEISSSHTS